MKVLMAAAWYPMTIARYWREGLREAGHEVDTLGYSTGAHQAWPGNPMLWDYAERPTYPLAEFRNVYQIDDALRQLAAGYDVFVNVDAAHSWRGGLPIKKVIIGTDPHCLNYDVQRRDCDLFVCMQQTYARPGDAWIPYAYDEKNHYNTFCTHTADVGFMGVEYAERKAELDALAAAGFRVRRGVGRILYEYSEFYSECLTAYCRPSLQDLPARFFEAAALGCVPLIRRIPELALFDCRDGEHYIGYDTTAELITRLRTLLNDDERLFAMRKAAHEWVRPHTWTNRARRLVELIEALP